MLLPLAAQVPPSRPDWNASPEANVLVVPVAPTPEAAQERDEVGAPGSILGIGGLLLVALLALVWAGRRLGVSLHRGPGGGRSGRGKQLDEELLPRSSFTSFSRLRHKKLHDKKYLLLMLKAELAQESSMAVSSPHSSPSSDRRVDDSPR
jgi:hypothetical protein